MRRLFLGLAIASIAVLSPCWVQADDQQIAQQIVQQLRQQKADGELTGFGIDLEVESGIVWLKGHVRSPEQRAIVLDVARRVGGVQQVVNDLQIKAAEEMAQPAVAEAAPAKSLVQPALLKTETSSRLLKKPGQLLTQLRGSVQRAFRPEQLEEAAVEKAEVAQTQPAHKPTQVAKATKPQASAMIQPKLAAAKPAPPAMAQPTPAEPTLAAPKLAKAPAPAQPTLAPRPAPEKPAKVAATPVSQVKPQPIRTRPVRTQPAQPSDEQLAEGIISRLRVQKDRGTLQNFDVDVQVDGRVVWVSGRVASDAQRCLVLDISRRVQGVKQVVDDLDVQVSPAMKSLATPVQTVASQMPSAEVAAQTAQVSTANAVAKAPAPFQYAPAPQPPTAVRAPAPVSQRPLAFAPAQSVAYNQQMYSQQPMGQPVPEMAAAAGIARARYDNPAMPGYAWPSYAAYPNYGAVTYPRQYSPTAWPYIGPFYPYPQVPLGWRKVTLEWDDGWWMLDFKSK